MTRGTRSKPAGSSSARAGAAASATRRMASRRDMSVARADTQMLALRRVALHAEGALRAVEQHRAELGPVRIVAGEAGEHLPVARILHALADGVAELRVRLVAARAQVEAGARQQVRLGRGVRRVADRAPAALDLDRVRAEGPRDLALDVGVAAQTGRALVAHEAPGVRGVGRVTVGAALPLDGGAVHTRPADLGLHLGV